MNGMKQQPVAIAVRDVRFVVPWSFAIPAMDMLQILRAGEESNQFTQLDLLLKAFTGFLDEEQLELFQRLDLSDATELIGEWLRASSEMKDFINDPD